MADNKPTNTHKPVIELAIAWMQKDPTRTISQAVRRFNLPTHSNLQRALEKKGRMVKCPHCESWYFKKAVTALTDLKGKPIKPTRLVAIMKEMEGI